MMEFGKTAEDKKILGLYASTSEIGRSILTAPGVSSSRVAILRKAFDAMTSDTSFPKDAKARSLEIDPLTGGELQKDIADVLSTSSEVAKRARAAGKPN